LVKIQKSFKKIPDASSLTHCAHTTGCAYLFTVNYFIV